MNIKSNTAVICLVLLLWFTCGCDIGRLGMYKLSLQQQRSRDSATRVTTGDEGMLKRLIRQTLERKKFEEQAGKPERWYKEGVWVELVRDEHGEFILKVWAFGGRRELRLSEETEHELLAVLSQQSWLQITPLDPNRRSVNFIPATRSAEGLSSTNGVDNLIPATPIRAD